jgi:hypothetical protein
VVALSADSLDLSDLTSSGSSLDVLEVDLGVFGEIDDGAKVVVETVGRLELLKQLDELDGTEEVRVLGGNLDNDGEVLGLVGLEHLFEARERLFSSELAKVVNEPLLISYRMP